MDILKMSKSSKSLRELFLKKHTFYTSYHEIKNILNIIFYKAY